MRILSVGIVRASGDAVAVTAGGRRSSGVIACIPASRGTIVNLGESLESLKGCEGLEVADQDVVRKAQRLRYLGEIE